MVRWPERPIGTGPRPESTHDGHEPIPKQIAALERMTFGQLRRRYAQVFGEAARSSNKQWIFRRIAWRIQALAEG